MEGERQRVREIPIESLTEQAIFPLGGREIVRVVCPTRDDGGETTCLMLTRRSTTRDLVAHLRGDSVALETGIVSMASLGQAEWLLAF